VSQLKGTIFAVGLKPSGVRSCDLQYMDKKGAKNVGDVTVKREGALLYVTLTASGKWRMIDSEVSVNNNAKFPGTRQGLIPLFFEHWHFYWPFAQTYTYVIDVSGYDLVGTLYIAVHADLYDSKQGIVSSWAADSTDAIPWYPNKSTYIAYVYEPEGGSVFLSARAVITAIV
jgi:hypothetical protein